MNGPSDGQERVEGRRERLDGLQERSEFFLEGAYLVIQRHGVGREGVEAAQRGLGVALEGGQFAPCLSERLAGFGEGVEGALAV